MFEKINSRIRKRLNFRPKTKPPQPVAVTVQTPSPAELARLSKEFNLERITQHVHERMAASKVIEEPGPHLIVDHLLPNDFYQKLVDAVPPSTYFTGGDNVRLKCRMSTPDLPQETRTLWGFMSYVVCPQVIQPATQAKFAAYFDDFYVQVFGKDMVRDGRTLPRSVSDQRFLLGRPGYKLKPHMDRKPVLLTHLLYLPKDPGSDERFGTQLFKVDREFVARYVETYYPGNDGMRCEYLKSMPYRWNTMATLMNSRVVHGADIPADQAPPTLERRAFQFYVSLDPEPLEEFVDTLPEELRTPWFAERTSLATPL